jgi:hypothetical protein
MKLTNLTEAKYTTGEDPFLLKCAHDVASSMMAHYWNHNVVTDGWEVQPQGFSEEELEQASNIDLSDPEFKRLVWETLREELKNA